MDIIWERMEPKAGRVARRVPLKRDPFRLVFGSYHLEKGLHFETDPEEAIQVSVFFKVSSKHMPQMHQWTRTMPTLAFARFVPLAYPPRKIHSLPVDKEAQQKCGPLVMHQFPFDETSPRYAKQPNVSLALTV